ncbi:site-2 protease family protein [Kallotenue papyrolyticum]|uniref:site-2 protease family protein n=1 Tax=Kallotenue papyrolyticum TaxID=1325125 RepID=UPI000492648A|nr:site-2 protease family protein [Kallotenue papyrolyticum]
MPLDTEPIATPTPLEVEAALEGLLAPHHIAMPAPDTLVIQGRLLGDTRTVYRALRTRFAALGYTPFLRPHADGVELIVTRGVVQRQPQRWELNLALFLATVVTVLLTGTFNELGQMAWSQVLRQPALLLRGLPYAATLLGILVAHEMGHYVVSRLRHAPASLPFFIPVPPLPGMLTLGTLGAVIVQREPFEDRRTLLEVAIAGPLAGLAVAIPLLLYGLATSPVGPPPPGLYLQEGNSALYALAKLLVFGRWLPSGGVDVQLNAVAWAAWIGLLVTMLNLLPIGQLDGGHIAYALFGRGAELIAYVVMGMCLVLGIFVSSAWLFWFVLALLMGPRHPPPFNDVEPLGPGHVALGALGLLLFLLLFTPRPLAVVIP